MEFELEAGGSLTIGILLFADVEILDFAGPYEVFSEASRLAGIKRNREPGPFRVLTVAEREDTIKTRGNLQVQPHYTIRNHPPLDILLVPGGWGTRREVDNPGLIRWIEQVANHARLKTSVCTGSFLLAKAGLLNGYQATTHWASLERFAASYPRVGVQGGVRWVDEGDVVTSAGVSAGIDMALHLVERLLGRELARETARQMEYEWRF